jgi:outer membrane protein assembly factor BamB
LVFVSANDGNLSALSVTTGLTVWSASVGGNLTAPAFVDGQVYVASTDGTVEALAESTGVPSWSVSLGGAITGAPAIDASKKLLVVGLSNGDVRAMDLTTGTTSWTYLTGGAVAAAVSIASGTVYFGSADEYVYAISELTGALDWSYQTGGAVMDTGVYTNHGTVAGPELVIGSNDGNLYVIHASNGSLEYQISYSSPIVGVGAASGVVVLETASGKISSDRTFVSDELWVYAAGGGLTSAPVIVDGTIYVAAQNGNLYAFTSYGQPPD